MNELFELARSCASKELWSKAVAISRQGQVFWDKSQSSTEEMIFRVKESSSAVLSLVKIWLKEEDSACDCKSQDDPCIHVVAAIIAMKTSQAKEATSNEDSSFDWSKIVYSFKRKEGFLIFDRMLQSSLDKKLVPLSHSLLAITTGRVKAQNIKPTKADLTIDSILQGSKDGLLSSALWLRIFPHLCSCEDILLDELPVLCRSETTGIEVIVEDKGPGVQVFGKQAEDIKEIFKNGVALCINGLKIIRQPDLTPFELSMLANGQYFGQSQMVELASETLVQLEKKLPVIKKTNRLGKKIFLRPRWEIISTISTGKLIYKGVIVYGDPEIARVEKGRLICSDADVIPERDFEEEKELAQLFYKKTGHHLEELLITDGFDAFTQTQNLIKKGLSEFMTGNGFERFFAKQDLHISFSFFENTHHQMDFDVLFKDEKNNSYKVDWNSLKSAFYKREPYIALLEGGFAPLDPNWLKIYGPILTDLIAAKEELGSVPKSLTKQLHKFQQMHREGEETRVLSFENLKTFEEIIPKEKDITLCLARLEAQLRDYQKEGICWLYKHKINGMGALLADDMGLGKTLQSIAILENKSLIVVPTSLMGNWNDEIRRFRLDLKAKIYHGLSRNLEGDWDILITSYTILRMDLEKLSSLDFRVVILDESQTIKNPESQIAQAVYQINAAFKLSLSGTPIENHLSDLWSQMHFLNPGLLGNYKHFQDYYVKEIQNSDHQRSAYLREKIKPFILRRTKSNVLSQLPPRTDVILYCELNEEERKIYEAIQLASYEKVMNQLGKGQGVIEALELLLRLRQASCHSALLPSDKLEQKNSLQTESSKLTLLMEELLSSLASGHKSLVFSQWTKFLDLIEKSLETRGIKTLRIDGSTGNRSDIVKTFQSKDSEAKILLLSLKAAGVGLNLTAADHVFILDPWWNPAAENQAADRAHRIGQDNPVMVHKLVAKNTVEEKILLLQEKKKQLAQMVLEDKLYGEQIQSSDLIELLKS